MTIEQASIGKGQVIGMHYSLYGVDGSLIESTENRAPVLFLYGERDVLAALQRALDGKVVGDTATVEIPAGQAYGRHYPERIQRLPRKRVDNGKQQSFRVGQIIQIDAGKGRRQRALVVKVGKFNLDLDTNHPLAGQDLRFDVTITEVRPATDSEIAHGHAHGPGGHPH